MPKDDVIEFEGTVVEVLPNATFKVKLPRELSRYTAPVFSVVLPVMVTF